MKAYKFFPTVLQSMLWPIARVVFHIFVKFEVKGIENIRGIKGPIIFASNHVSELDPILVRAALPFIRKPAPLFYVSRKNYLDSINGIRKHFYGGLFFKAWGAYPIESGEKDYEKALINHINLLKDGCSVCIFPEGKMSEDGRLGEVHGGTAFLAKKTDAQICPVLIEGPFQLTSRQFFRRKGKIRITFKTPQKIDALLPKRESLNAEDYRYATRMLLAA